MRRDSSSRPEFGTTVFAAPAPTHECSPARAAPLPWLAVARPSVPARATDRSASVAADAAFQYNL